MSKPKLTHAEQLAKMILESKGWSVTKPSYPDFLVYDEKRGCFCLVEVKTMHA